MRFNDLLKKFHFLPHMDHHPLDDLIRKIKLEEASRINQGGYEKQLEFLVEFIGTTETDKVLSNLKISFPKLPKVQVSSRNNSHITETC